MAVDTEFASLFNNLKVEDPWLPSRPWESIPTESGPSTSHSSPCNSTRFYDTSTVSEASLVRLAMNSLQGLQSSLTSIEKLCAVFRSDPTDRTFHRIPSLWNQSVTTLALEKILRSIGCMGCEVFLLHKFVHHFTNLNTNHTAESESKDYPPYSLVNQAFAVAVGDVLEGYIAALDTLSSSVGLRRLSSTLGMGFLSSVGHSELTLLEVYLHTKELRNQIEVIGSICNVHNLALCFSLSPLEDLDTQTKFSEFPRGGNLLTYLHTELKVADPVHCGLLKTLFVRSCEPYFDFIRSWIFKAKIIDPFNEFIVANNQQSYSLSNIDEFPSATIREEDGVSIPCFLKELLIPLFRAGEQLQVLIKLLEFSDGVAGWNRTYEEFLPYWSRMSHASSHLSFSKKGIKMMVLARRHYYETMMEKLKNQLPNLEFKYHQVVPQPTFVSSSTGSLEAVPSSSAKNVLPLGTVDSDASEEEEEEDSYESSSIENSDEEEEGDESKKMVEFFHDSEDLEKKYLSALEFHSNIPLKKPCQSIGRSSSHELSKDVNSQMNIPHHSQIDLDLNLAREVGSKCQHPCGDAWRSWNVECGNLSKLRERGSKVYLPCFDFSSVKDPFTQCVNKLGRGDFVPSSNNIMENKDDAVAVKKTNKPLYAAALLDHQEQSFLLHNNVTTGGSSWEVLLDGPPNTNDIQPPHENNNTSAAAVIEMPLDYVLEKCLLEEIQLQYIYVSKLTIKLLEEGFCLQQHLLALRRYHMMESADWADLFIISLGHHKWHVTEADKGISEIQGLMELAVQRSSCERDHYKDRLFLYMKDQASTSLPTAFATGIQCFNVLGLGYRVEWPISIVLTPGALKIYAQIFSFLLQVKLALSSLTQVWCSFKELIHSNLHKTNAYHFNTMVKLRQQIFHFVSTLQQYVQSQLSHVSWCRFLESLKHKVKDLMDLEFVHMDYLNDSLCICFLSSDMKQIGDIIQNILQCALDFGSNNSDGNMVEVKEAFEENMRQLYGWYLKSPKNVEFSLPRFWEYLNYNNHYSDIFAKQTLFSTF